MKYYVSVDKSRNAYQNADNLKEVIDRLSALSGKDIEIDKYFPLCENVDITILYQFCFSRGFLLNREQKMILTNTSEGENVMGKENTYKAYTLEDIMGKVENFNQELRKISYDFETILREEMDNVHHQNVYLYLGAAMSELNNLQKSSQEFDNKLSSLKNVLDMEAFQRIE